MNRIQKIALFTVITILSAIIITVIAFGILNAKIGTPKASVAISFMGLAGISGFSPLIFRKDKGLVLFDERDRWIKRTAALSGFAASYLFVGLACMIPFSVLGPKASIAVRWLPLLFAGAGLTHFFVCSLMILILYGRGGKDGQC